MHRHLATAIALSMASSVALGVEVKFWPTKVPVPFGVVVEDHPCGSAISLETDVVPRDMPWLEPDQVREIDADGNTLRLWRVPIDHYPVAIEGDTLVMAFGSSPTSILKITPDGKLSVAPRPARAFPAFTSCPKKIDESYACAVLSEVPKRYLAFPMVCT